MDNDINPVFNFKTGSIFLSDFPAVAGITPIAAGDFSKNSVHDEFILDHQLTNQLGGHSYHKIYDGQSNAIVFSNDCGAYRYCGALISYQETYEPEVLICTTADSATVVLATEDHKLIAIIYCGEDETADWIVPKTIEVIRRRCKIDPGEIVVGLFPGICHRCNGSVDESHRDDPLLRLDEGIDLKRIIQRQLWDSNIDSLKVRYSHLCSYESKFRVDGKPILYSARRNDQQRNAVFISRIPF